MRTLLCLLLLLGLKGFGAVSTPGGGATSGSGGGSLIGTTQGGKLWVWDDFTTGVSSSLSSLTMMNRKIQNLPDNLPLSGFVWRDVDGGTGGSNALTVASGLMYFDTNRVTGIVAGAGYGWHMYVSNGLPAQGYPHGFSRIGGVISFVNTPNVNGQRLNTVFILGPTALMNGGSPGGNFLHCKITYDRATIQVGATGSLLLDQVLPGQMFPSNQYNVDIQCVSNVVFCQVGPYLYSATDPIISTLSGPANGIIADYELFGSPSNTTHFRFHQIWAGQAEPWAVQAAAAANVVGNVGFGGGSTNFVLLDNNLQQYINGGAANVNISAVMLTDTNFVQGTATKYWTLTITNGSGSDKLLSWVGSTASNRWRFAGVYGTNGNLTLTNNTGLIMSVKQNGTNFLGNYSYYSWPF
jgi:hypothetical protein